MSKIQIPTDLFKKIQSTLRALFEQTDSAEWQTIVAAIECDIPEARERGFNWLIVRSVLRAMPNVSRTDDIHNEVFVFSK